VVLAELREIGDPRHRSVLIHHLAHDPRGYQPGKPGEVDCRLGLACSLEDAAGTRSQRKDVARVDEIGSCAVGIDRGLDRPRSVRGGDPGRHTLPSLDRDRERGLERRLVVLGHRAK
jgi:hypothetical protein